LEKNFHLESDFKVWKLEVAEEAGILLVELRNEEYRDTCFMALQLNSGDVLWDDLQFEENWWVNLVGCSKGKAIFQGYSDGEKPVADLLKVLDIASKQTLWEKSGFLLKAIVADKMAVITPKGEEVVLSLQNGQVLAEHLPTEKISTARQLHPVLHLTDSPHFETFSTFIEQKLGLQLQKAVEYLETAQGFILAFYATSDGQEAQHLYVIGSNGEVRYHDILAQEAQAIGDSSFFVFDGQLVYVRKKCELIGMKGV